MIDLSLAAVLENDRAGISRAEAERLLTRRQPSPAWRHAAGRRDRAAGAWSRTAMEHGMRAGVFYAAETFAAALPLVSGPAS